MRQVVAWSWRQLPPDVTLMLCALTVFNLPVSAEAAAQALAGLRDPSPASSDGAPEPLEAFDDAPTAAAQVLLAEAVEWSLLQPVATELPAAGHSLYALLQPVREFAAEQITAVQAAAARSRLRRWLCTQATFRLRQH